MKKVAVPMPRHRHVRVNNNFIRSSKRTTNSDLLVQAVAVEPDFPLARLDRARKSYEDSLAIRRQTGEKLTASETELALARLAIEEGHAADAENVIRKCKEQFHQHQQAADQLAAALC